MSTDADHEVIDSPEALFRHLYEAHQVEEALDLDPASAPVQFWLRRHAELERARRETGRRPAEPGPRRPAAGRDGRRPAGFGDPLVEAVARALAGRGHDEAAVRGAIRGYASPAGGRTGEAAVRGDFVEPMLRAAAERLLGAGEGAGPPAPAGRAPAVPPQANRPESERPEAGRPEGSGEPRRGAPVDRPEGSGEPQGGAPVRPEAAWAGLWADLGEGGAARRAAAGRPPGADDDLMAIADAVQRRRGRRLAEREPRPLRR
jgi:translation initiation factor IF-2